MGKSSPTSLHPYVSSKALLEISLNGGIDFVDTGFFFIYKKIASLNVIQPNYGYEMGGDTVIMNGSGFYPSEIAKCVLEQ